MKGKTLNTTVKPENESKHTPGPWITDTSHKYDREGITIWAHDVIIADVVEDQHQNEEANARLIASAPDMLEALKKANAIILEMGAIIRRIDDDNDHSDFWTLDGEYVPGCEFIQAAIAKATNTE